jgi:DNA-binding HxlR family transcriptional regulator
MLYRVLLTLAEKPARFGELRARLPCLSDKVLAERLDDLERKGLIARINDRANSRFPVYELTPQAHALGPVMEALAGWGNGIAAQLGVSVTGSPPPVLWPKINLCGIDGSGTDPSTG